MIATDKDREKSEVYAAVHRSALAVHDLIALPHTGAVRADVKELGDGRSGKRRPQAVLAWRRVRALEKLLRAASGTALCWTEDEQTASASGDRG